MIRSRHLFFLRQKLNLNQADFTEIGLYPKDIKELESLEKLGTSEEFEKLLKIDVFLSLKYGRKAVKDLLRKIDTDLTVIRKSDKGVVDE